MHLGIITSGNETLLPTKFLHNYCTKYTIWYDSLYRPYGDKPLKTVVQRTLEGIKRLREQGVDKILLPPLMEMLLIGYAFFDVHNSKNQQGQSFDLSMFQSLNLSILQSFDISDILPLFQKYVTDWCFHHSLVGKLGIVGTALDIQYGQQCLQHFAQHYKPTHKQKNTKKFCQPFSWRSKAVPMRNYFLRILSGRADMMNKIIKTDCRYFKDANVDTLIPMQYSYFAFAQKFHRYFNPKKQKFHGIKALEESFVSIIGRDVLIERPHQRSHQQLQLQSVAIHFTGSDHLFTDHKKWAWMVSAGDPERITVVR